MVPCNFTWPFSFVEEASILEEMFVARQNKPKKSHDTHATACRRKVASKNCRVTIVRLFVARQLSSSEHTLTLAAGPIWQAIHPAGSVLPQVP